MEVQISLIERLTTRHFDYSDTDSLNYIANKLSETIKEWYPIPEDDDLVVLTIDEDEFTAGLIYTLCTDHRVAVLEDSITINTVNKLLDGKYWSDSILKTYFNGTIGVPPNGTMRNIVNYVLNNLQSVVNESMIELSSNEEDGIDGNAKFVRRSIRAKAKRSIY